MIDFKEITLEDREWVQPLLDASHYRAAEYSFSFMYLWREPLAYRIARINDYFVLISLKSQYPPSYLFPAGKGDIRPVLEALEQDAKERDILFIFHAVPQRGREILDSIMPDRFEYLPLTKYFDYVYESERMISLKGKKLSSKRNHINKFKEEYSNWNYEPITRENMHEVEQLNAEWVKIESKEDHSSSFLQEADSVVGAMEHFEELGLQGGLLRADGRPVAFTMGDRVTEDTLLIHIEKAFKDVRGAYPLINQQFAEHIGKDYTYINREDDAGNPGLKRAKESYQPVFLLEKFAAKAKY